MPSTAPPKNQPVSPRSVIRAFRDWRTTRKRGSHTPEILRWQAAMLLLTYSKSDVRHALGVNASSLQRWAAEVGIDANGTPSRSTESSDTASSESGFVALPMAIGAHGALTQNVTTDEPSVGDCQLTLELAGGIRVAVSANALSAATLIGALHQEGL